MTRTTFTEHNEVIISVDALRELIRLSFTVGWRERNDNVPVTFPAERHVMEIEKHLRKFGDVPQTN